MHILENKQKEHVTNICIIYSEESTPGEFKTYVWQDVDNPQTLYRFKEFAQAFEAQQDKKIISFQRVKIANEE
jgi:predicted DNA binding CopG/RHH family protein